MQNLDLGHCSVLLVCYTLTYGSELTRSCLPQTMGKGGEHGLCVCLVGFGFLDFFFFFFNCIG